MLDKLIFDIDRMQADIRALRGGGEALAARMTDIQALLERISAVWQGEASEAFHRQFAEDQWKFAALCQTLYELTDSMEASRTQYAKCEDRLQRAIAQVKSV